MPQYQYREAKKSPSAGKKLDHLEVREGEEGGHVVSHHYAADGMTYHKPKDYAFGADEGKDVMAHIAKHAHINADESGRAEKSEEEVEA